jgi:hypothetical protein
MSSPAQLVGIAGVTVAAAVLGRLPVLAEDRPEAELAAGVLAIALRYAFIAVLEGEFSLSHLEWAVAVYGNPGSHAVTGGLVVFGKFALPMIVCFGLVGARLPPARLRGAFYVAIAFLLLRLGHILASLLLTRGQYYTPHGDLAELMYMAGFVAALPLAAAALSSRSR